MLKQEEKAVVAFQSGLNCAQSVLTAYSERLNFDNKLAMMVSTGFGGGMGRLQEKCGAVTGAFMVLGIVNAQKFTDNQDRKSATYSMVQEFNSKFTSTFGSTNCRSLLNCDLNTEEGQKKVVDEDLHGRVCEKCISGSIKIIDELIK